MSYERRRASTSSSASRSATSGPDLAPGPAPARDPGVRDQRVHGRRGRRRVVEEHTEESPGTRSSTSSSPAARPSRSTARSIDAPAGTLVYCPTRGEAHGGRARAGHDRARGRRQAAARRSTPSGVGGGRSRAVSRLPPDEAECALSRGPGSRSYPDDLAGLLQPRLLRGCARATATARSTQLRRARSSSTPTVVREVRRAATRTSTPIYDAAASLAITGQAHARRARERRHRVGLRPRDEQHRAVARSPTSASTSSCSPTASANALCACSPPNGTSSSARRRPASTSPWVTSPHRDVGDERPPVRARDRDRERVRPRELRAAVRMARAAAARSRSARRRGPPSASLRTQ